LAESFGGRLSVFERSNIVSEGDLAAAASWLDAATGAISRKSERRE